MFLLSSVRTIIFNSCFLMSKFDLIFASFCTKSEQYAIGLIWFCNQLSEGEIA